MTLGESGVTKQLQKNYKRLQKAVQPFGSLFRREVLNKDLLLKKVLIRSLFGPKGPYFQLSNPNNALYLLFFNLPREVIS